MRLAVMHHVVTGLAMAPYFGPMYGPKAVGEQKLAEALIDRLPESSVLIGDRNFGVFSVAWHAHKCGHKVLVRLTEPRAGKLNGGSDPVAGSDRKVTWQPGEGDRRGHPELTGEERMEGRLIAIFSEEALEILYLFTTLEEETAETVALLYKERWHIETDLRSLKEQVRLDTIPARSPGLVACELLMAIACYNLIRALMAEAAKQIGIEPRRLSFSRSRAMFRAFSRAVSHVESEEEFQRRWKILLRFNQPVQTAATQQTIRAPGNLAGTSELPFPKGSKNVRQQNLSGIGRNRPSKTRARSADSFKEDLDKILPRRFDSRNDFMIWILKHFDTPRARTRNRSFDYLVRRLTELAATAQEI